MPESLTEFRVRRARACAALLLGCAAIVFAGACSWSVPADPALNAQTAAWDDPGARALYMDRCGRCHEPWPTTHVTAAEWPRYVARYGPEAGLFGADRARVLRWLQAHAR
jgi:cytochrome c553